MLIRALNWIDERDATVIGFWIACCALGIGWGLYFWGPLSIWVMP